MSEIEFLQFKGIHNTHQLNKRYNLTIAEMIEFLREYSKIKLNQHTEGIPMDKFDNRQKIIQFT